jgi:DNA excision repair protein ERCC-2
MPAFTNVLQNAGRCIRSEKDRGVVIYLDERYSWSSYRKYFPGSVNLIESRNYEKVKEFFS